MTRETIFSMLRAMLARWTKLVPALFRHDPLFRYATIATVLALIFLIAGLARDFLGPGTIPPADLDAENKPAASEGVRSDGANAGSRSATTEPPVPGPATAPPAPEDASPPMIAPGRSLEGLDMAPAPRDSFGTLPTEKEGSSP